MRHLPAVLLTLEVLALLLLAAGAAAFAWHWIGATALAVAGAVVITGTWLAEDAMRARTARTKREARR